MPASLKQLAGNNVMINFLGELQSACTPLGPWSKDTDSATYIVSPADAAKYYRAVE